MATIDLDQIIPAEAWEFEKYGPSEAHAGYYGLAYGSNIEFITPWVGSRYEGLTRSFGLGGWDPDGHGRKVTDGPIEKGPHAYLFGLGTMIAAAPQPTKTKILFEEGDHLIVRGETYRVEFDSKWDRTHEWPKLVHVEGES
jgi:hypothetical protein